MFNPSKYQLSILDFVKTGKGDLVVNAVAGAGKTTTLKMIANELANHSALFLAFNKHIATELADKIPSECRTIHSLGYGMIARYKRPKMKNYKYWNILDTLLVKYSNHPDFADIKKAAIKLTDLCRSNLTDNVMDVSAHYGVNMVDPDVVIELVTNAIKAGIELYKKTGEIDYTDMIFLPDALNLSSSKTYQFVMVDECQDLSPAQLSIAMKARALGGRMIFVGDRNQAIMGFAGADSNSVDSIIEKTNATELPLSICYRCPTSHLDIARGLVPQIEAKEGAIDGVFNETSIDNLVDLVGIGDLVMCRLTAPLVKQCLKMIASGIPARVRGRDIGRGLISIIKKVVNQPNYDWSCFVDCLRQWQSEQIEKITKKEKYPDSKIESLVDRCGAIMAVYESCYNGQSEQCLIDKITKMFEDKKAGVWLSTIHRAKGLESDNAYIIDGHRLPYDFGGQDWQKQQETNLAYVAYTRAKISLTIVKGV